MPSNPDLTPEVAAERERCQQLISVAIATGGGDRLYHAVRAIQRGDTIEQFRSHLIAHHGVRPGAFGGV